MRWTRRTLTWGSALGLALVDGLSRSSDDYSPMVFVGTIGAWVLLASVLALSFAAFERLALGSGGLDRLRGASLNSVRAFLTPADPDVESKRVATLIGVLLGGCSWFVSSTLVLARMVDKLHGPLLIAVAGLCVAILLVGVGATIALATRRLLGWLLPRLPLTVRAKHVCLAIGVILVLIVGAIVFRFGSLLDDADAYAIVIMPLVLIVVAACVCRFEGRTSWLAPLGLVVGMVLLVLASRDQLTRRSLASTGQSSRHVVAGLLAATDFDGDGAGFLPYPEDCAPFDGARHRSAVEEPGNGVDENCDGLDTVPVFQRPMPATQDTAPEGKPDIILITMDATRRDALGFGGGPPDLTPNLDRFAGQSANFSQAYSQDSGTGPSLWSLMAGKTPFQTRVQSTTRWPPNIEPSEPVLAELLANHGYATSALLCGSVFAKPNWSLRRGFQTFNEICGRTKAAQAEQVTAQALLKLAALRRRSKPFFLWVHYYDPHSPYHDHPDQNRGEGARAWYDEELHYADEHIGRFLESAQGGERRVYIALSADHGENFGDHGTARHARTLYREVTNVPLLVWGADVDARTIDSPVAVNDLHPTFLALAHHEHTHSTMLDLGSVLRGGELDPSRSVFQENSFSRPRRHVKAVIRGRHHLIFDVSTDTVELYDLIEDPAERDNLVGRGLPVEGELRNEILGFRNTTRIPDQLPR